MTVSFYYFYFRIWHSSKLSFLDIIFSRIVLFQKEMHSIDLRAAPENLVNLLVFPIIN